LLSTSTCFRKADAKVETIFELTKQNLNFFEKNFFNLISSRFYNFNFSTFATLFVISITDPFDYCERDTKIEHLILSANFLPLFFIFFIKKPF